ncbi:unnamed protein product, partial [Adineta steineri]
DFFTEITSTVTESN